jgi:hypothetical protein
LELIAPGNDPSPPMAVFKEPTITETTPLQSAPSETLEEAAPLVLVPPVLTPPMMMPPDFVPPVAAMSTAGMPPPSFSSPYVPYQAGPQIPPYGEKWRYMTSNGVVWFYTPQRKWMYWCDGRWVQYESPVYSNTPIGLQPPAVSHRFRRAAGKVGVGGGAPSFADPYPGVSGGGVY